MRVSGPSRALGVGLALCIVPAVAAAWPVDVYLDLEVGGETFHPLASLSWAEVEDPKVATAEWLDTGELLLTGKSPGRTLLLLYADGKLAVWRLRVTPKGQRPKPHLSGEAPKAASKACPSLKAGGEALEASIPDERCRASLAALLETDRYRAKDVTVVFEVGALQSQLAAISDALAALGIQADVRYLGAGLVLGGTASEREHRRALWEVFRRSVGKVVLEDQMEVTKSPP